MDIQEHVHRKVMEIDFFAPWILTHGVIDGKYLAKIMPWLTGPLHAGMIKEGFGHIVNVSSIWGKAAPSNRSAYASAKFGIIGLMDSIRYEVRMNTIWGGVDHGSVKSAIFCSHCSPWLQVMSQ